MFELSPEALLYGLIPLYLISPSLSGLWACFVFLGAAFAITPDASTYVLLVAVGLARQLIFSRFSK